MRRLIKAQTKFSKEHAANPNVDHDPSSVIGLIQRAVGVRTQMKDTRLDFSDVSTTDSTFLYKVLEILCKVSLQIVI